MINTNTCITLNWVCPQLAPLKRVLKEYVVQ